MIDEGAERLAVEERWIVVEKVPVSLMKEGQLLGENLKCSIMALRS